MAMTDTELQDRINKCEAKIVKIDKRIAKWEAAKSDKGLEKEYYYLKEPDGTYQVGWDRATGKTLYGDFGAVKAKYQDDFFHNCDVEIRHANEEKEACLVTISKYKNALAMVQTKNSKPVIQIFKDFFNKWKEEIIEYVTPLVAAYYEANSLYCTTYNNRSSMIGPDKQYKTEEEYEKALKEADAKETAIRSIPIVRIALDKGLRRDDSDFNKYLDDYMNDRYFELVDKVTQFTGEITDVTGLGIGVDGSLNGIVIGVDGKAKLETIIAGGYNQDVIVNVKHGQCKHYRVLVHEVK